MASPCLAWRVKVKLRPWEVHCVTVGVHQGLLSLRHSSPKQRTLYRSQNRVKLKFRCLLGLPVGWAGGTAPCARLGQAAAPGMSSTASNLKLPGRGRMRANPWAIGALPVAAAGGTDGDIWHTWVSAQGLELTSNPCCHSRHSSVLWGFSQRNSCHPGSVLPASPEDALQHDYI